MDVSPRALRAVTFREKLRGYHPDDVDQFLERVAEGVAALQGKLDAALARAEKAEAERPVDGEDAVQRTLVLAQRTADMALKEAKEEAARLIADARDAAQRLAEEGQRQLRADIEKLDTARRQLQEDVVAMQQYVDAERTRVRNALAELVRKVDSTTRKSPAPPAPTPVELPPQRQVLSIPDAAPEPAEPLPAEPAAMDPAPVEAAEFAPVEPEAPRVRREPQPPPVAANPFVAAKVGGRPSGPPPGPHRFALAEGGGRTDDPNGAERADEPEPDTAEPSGLRRLFGR